MNIFFILIILVLIIVSWGYLDYSIGKKRYFNKMKKRSYPMRQSQITFIGEGEELFEQLFRDIEQAKSSIHVLFYIVKTDETSRDFLIRLKRKAKEGVTVRLLLDWVGSFPLSRTWINELESAGVHFSYCHRPRFPFYLYTLHQRNHRKIAVIDGSIGYLGGFNIGKEYVNRHPTLTPWRDYHIRLEGEGVADLQTEFLYDWYRETNEQLWEEPSLFPPLPKGPISHQIVPSGGNQVEEAFRSSIQRAKNSIFIGSPYFVPSEKVFRALIGAVRRGVQLTILVPFHSDHMLVKEASYRYFRVLLPYENVTIYQYVKGFYHGKVVIIDDKVMDIGSANFDVRSMNLNHELNCFIYDKAFIHTVKDYIHRDLLLAHILTDTDLQVGFKTKVKEWTAQLVTPWL
jgi:cardiolipin synthase A/B